MLIAIGPGAGRAVAHGDDRGWSECRPNGFDELDRLPRATFTDDRNLADSFGGEKCAVEPLCKSGWVAREVTLDQVQ